MADSARQADDAPTATGRPLSLHQRILNDVEGHILSGDWPPGHRIPFEHELMTSYGCSRMTVNKALTQLAAAGLVERRRRSGTFVRAPVSQSAVLEIHDVRAEVEATGQAYGYRLLSSTRRSTTDTDSKRLRALLRGEVLAVTCLHMADDTSFCHEDRLISLEAVPEAAEADFADGAPGPWLVRQVPWTVAEHRINSRSASPTLARALALRPAAAVLDVERTTWIGDRVVTNARFTYPAGRHELVARFAPAHASDDPATG
jgi:GntR family histidine utilization transcriptional repressor